MKAPKCRLCGELHWGGCTVFTADGPPPKPVAVDKGFRTKGSDAPTNQVAALEITNSALMAKVDKLKSEKAGLEAEVERLNIELAKALLEVELQRTAVEVLASANEKLLTARADTVNTVNSVNSPVNTLATASVNSVNIDAKLDRSTYRREWMRKRRATEKAAKASADQGRS